MGFEPTTPRATIWYSNQLSYIHQAAILVASPEGFEPPTHGLEGRCSVQLSYRDIIWSGWRESNPRNQLGRLGLYHWATPAQQKSLYIIYDTVFKAEIHFCWSRMTGCFLELIATCCPTEFSISINCKQSQFCLHYLCRIQWGKKSAPDYILGTMSAKDHSYF